MVMLLDLGQLSRSWDSRKQGLEGLPFRSDALDLCEWFLS
jgi:hypothetical protein